jgi:hypothetical protein
MRLLTRAWHIVLVALVLALAAGGGVAVRDRTGDLPARLSDAEFWDLVERLSEPDGFFDSDNLVSNEDGFQFVVPDLSATVRPGGAYLGVGPDQNFTYILAVAPKIAFITDVRRGNLQVHLLYKALFEMSPDRAEFLARLFGRPRPPGLGPRTPVADLLRAYRAVAAAPAYHEETRRRIAEQLSGGAPRFRLRSDDLPAIAAIHAEFVAAGPDLRFVSSRGGNWYPTYTELQTATDRAGVARGYLSGEAQYARLRELQRNNLIVPVVGNFGGPKALREIGRYLRQHGEFVSVFYTSNVERYLFRDGLWDEFARNLMALPMDPTSTLIRSCFDSCSSPGDSRAVTLVDSMSGLSKDVAAGRIRTYWDVLSRSRK